MRNGLLLAVGALALALLPAVSNASAPIFTDVPGVIVLNEDNGSTMAATNIFVFDSSVYDPDTADADLAWSFIETAEGLAVTDVDGAGPANIFMTVDGIGAVADAAAARALTAASASNIAGGATAMSLVVSKNTTGPAVSNSAVVMAAGTNNAFAPATDDLFTTIIIAVTDGVNATYKTVLVKSDYGTPAASNRGGLYENVPGASFTNANLNTALTFIDQWGNGIVTNGNATNAVQINASGANLVFNASTLGFSGPWGYGYFQTTTGTNDFTVQKGYVYRLRANVAAVNATAAGDVANLRMRMQPFANDFVAEFVLQPQDATGYVDPVNLFNANASHSESLEALLQPPQEARLSGKAYNTTYNYYLEYTPYFNTQTAAVKFSDVVLDRFVIPAANSNGLLYYADTNAQWTTFTNDDGTTVAAPFAWGNALGTDPNYLSKGWRLAPRGLTGFLISGNELALPYVEHTDFAVARGLAATNVNDGITTIRTGAQANEGAVQVFSKNTVDANYKGTFSELFIGQTEPAGITNNSYSLVGGALLNSLKDTVYYRCTMSCKVAAGNPLSRNPQLYLRLGTPNAGWGGNIQVNEESASAPSPTEWTNYVTWVRGMPQFNSQPQMNMTIKLQVVDTNFNQGLGGFAGDNGIGGTVAIDTMSLEMFPAAFWN